MKKIGMICMMAAVCLLAGCGKADSSLTGAEAAKEMTALLKNVKVKTVKNPTMDIYSDDVSEADALASIDTFPITVKGNGDIDIEIAAATEMSAEAPDDWLNVVADRFNKERKEIDGKTVSVSIRKITSGEVLTYMKYGNYQPDLYIPSNEAWGRMLNASGIGTTTLADRIAGNTAGLLIRKKAYDEFVSKYGEATVKTVMEACNAGDLQFAYTNPYTSSTGLNILASMLKAFDKKNPLSDTATKALLDYQKTSPPVAYTTAVLKKQAEKGIIDAMVMEEQAYINTPALKDFVYIPAGIRHDHPVYTFDYVDEDKRKVAQLFVKYCLNAESQKLASEKGFNLHEDYIGDEGLDGNGYLAAQKVWKENKSGGKPIAAVFVADVSGSMAGEPLNSLKESLINASVYIGSEHYIGLVSFSDGVTINLPIEQFDAKQRAYFSGEVKGLSASGGTATYNAVLVALDMLQKKAEELDVKLMLFVLTDGAQNAGYELSRITPLIEGMQVPVYSIAYNYHGSKDLETMSDINEAAFISADSADIPNVLRNLFNVSM